MEQIINYREIPIDRRLDVLNSLLDIGFTPAYGGLKTITEYAQAPWASGVKLKDGTLLKTLYGGPGTSGYAFDRVINVDEVDSIIFAKGQIDDIGEATEDDYYLVPLK